MNISKIGSVHIEKMCNNQDFFFAEEGFKLLTDGCSAGKDSDFGTRLFIKLITMQEGYNDIEKFEKNVKIVFSKMFSIFNVEIGEKMKKNDYEFLVNNFLFTILACFELEDKFVVIFLGDGYIITENVYGKLSFIKINYGTYPPYYVYNYMLDKNKNSFKEELEFKKYEFQKSLFKRVGIASDGIAPVVFSDKLDYQEKKKLDSFLLNTQNIPENRNINQVSNIIQRNSQIFYDDTTIVF